MTTTITSETIRTEGKYPLYLGIATKALITFDQIEQATDRDRMTHDEFIYHRIERQKQYSVMIVFAGMCIEAFLYDYLAHEIGDDYVRKNIDSLRFLEKCTVYPRMLTGIAIDNGSLAWNRLVILNRARNALVHGKSEAPHGDSAIEEERNRQRADEANRLPQAAHEAFSAISLYAQELQRIHLKATKENVFVDLLIRTADEELKQIQSARRRLTQ